MPNQFFNVKYSNLQYLYLQNNIIAGMALLSFASFSVSHLETYDWQYVPYGGTDIYDQYSFYLYHNYTDRNTSWKIPVGYSFDGGVIDISNNRIEGMLVIVFCCFSYKGHYPFEFYSPNGTDQPTAPFKLHYIAIVNFNRYVLSWMIGLLTL
jgi:hypothetical protein